MTWTFSQFCAVLESRGPPQGEAPASRRHKTWTWLESPAETYSPRGRDHALSVTVGTLLG
jgi:hypothetical protein